MSLSKMPTNMEHVMPTDRDEKIRQRAYELWEQDGAQHGRDQDYWHEAVEQIDAEERAAKAPPKKAPAPARKTGAKKPTSTAAKKAASDGEAPKPRGRSRKAAADDSAKPSIKDALRDAKSPKK